jgi:hypothetical protein
LDSDAVPEEIDPEDHYAKREMPKDGWDCFGLTRLDRQNLANQNLPAVRGYLSTHAPTLPPRLWELGIWLVKLSNQPAAVWWAAGQDGIRPQIQRQIRFELERRGKTASAEVRRAWRYILESWNTNRNEFHRDWFELEASIA